MKVNRNEERKGDTKRNRREQIKDGPKGMNENLT